MSIPNNTQNGQPGQRHFRPGDRSAFWESDSPDAPLSAPASAWLSALDTILEPWPETHVAALAAHAPPPRLSRPLLLLTAGTAGARIAVHAKAGLIDRFGRLPQNAAILAFDSANEPNSSRSYRTRQPVTLEPDHEFHLFDPVPLAGIKHYPGRHPELVERMGDNLGRIFRQTVYGGAARERPQGLLYVVWHAPVIDRLIENTLRRLTARDDDLHQDVQVEPGVNIVIAGSVCGGQASGSMLDLAYLVRENLRRRGDLADTSKVIGLYLLPGAFPDVRNPNLLPNAYAFFLEQDALMQGDGFTARYPGNLTIESVERPVDLSLVVDGVDENGRSWRNNDEVCALAGRALTLLFASEVGRREAGIAINYEESLREVSANGFGAYLGTIGQAILHFPAPRVAEACTVRQAITVVDALLAEPAAAPAPDQPEPDAFALNLGQVRDRLRQNRDGAAYDLRVDAPAGLEQAPAEEMPALARNYFHNVRQRRLIEGCFEQMKAVLAALLHANEQRLGERLQGLVNEGALVPAQQWLAAVQAEFRLAQKSVASQQHTLAQAITQREAALENAAIAMTHAAESFFIGRAARTRAAVNTYLTEADRLVQFYFAQRVEETCAELVEHLLQWVEHRQQLLQSAQSKVRHLRGGLQQHAVELARSTAGAHEISLAEPPLVEHLFATYRGSLQADVQGFLAAAGDPLAWAHTPASALAQTLLQTTARAFRPILQITVEDVLRQYLPERSPQYWQNLLQELAAGAWNLDRSLLPAGGAGVPHQLILGVPDAEQTLFAGSGLTLVSTNDPERIVALRTIYGASFDALKPAVLWQRAYANAAGRIPLHILPGFLTDDERTVQHFALGQIFDFIYEQSKQRFAYRPEDGLEAPVPLGHGLRNALRTFQQQKSLATRVGVRTDAWIAAHGANQALRLIDAYVNRPTRDEVSKLLQRAARTYADSLRRNHPAPGEK